uniref:RING-type domain-containing protein n=1 Tax=Chlamydomonas euryale TaxID=1486919 RepID=A0A7R9VZT1_9CHLO|mmetsp:Transcript_8176/g.24659  ORF Transcript_8176/g.24659 Transcript_8176/m.24659 type:complete len:442 (+) Transcript_8176:178-1503(+)
MERSLAQAYRNRPAETSESSALYGMDPMHLAQLALNDAAKAVDGMPQWTKAYSRKGLALFLLERYSEAEEAYLAGLGVDPTCKALQEGLAQVAKVLDAAKSTVKRQRSVNRNLDELECTLCLRLLYEPVTTPCGHTFCRGCYARSTDAGNKCPLCRTVLHCGRALPITVTLASLISRAFPAEYQERKEEEDASAASRPVGTAGRTSSSQDTAAINGVVTMPVFVMNSVLPFECMALNIFEPRYRLMIRRAMEGNRRFGMAQMGRNRQLESVFTEVEITECSPLPDGRYHIEVIGRRRMRLRSTSDLDGYRIAQAEPLSDELEADDVTPPLSLLGVEVGAGVDTLITRLRTVGGTNPGVREVLQCMGPRPVPGAAEADGADARERTQTYLERLSFWTAALLVQVSRAAVRFELLQSTSTRSRLLWCKEQLGRLDNTERCCIM